MAASLRLNKEQQELVRKKAIEINKRLVSLGREPIRDSELLHTVINKGVPEIEVGRNGELRIGL